MALPRLTGYGYGRAAQFALQQGSYGQGMVLPNFQVPHSRAGNIPGHVGIQQSPGSVVSAGSVGPGRAPALWGSPAPSQRGVGPLSPLQWGVGARAGVTAAPRGAQRSALENRYAQEGKLALGSAIASRLGRFRSRDEAAGEPPSAMALGPAGVSPAPLSAGLRPAGAIGPATAREQGPVPLARPHGPIIEAKAQEMLPGTDVPGHPLLAGAPIPSTRAPRNRRNAFNPNQGLLF